jgi:hypothetical protein
MRNINAIYVEITLQLLDCVLFTTITYGYVFHRVKSSGLRCV